MQMRKKRQETTTPDVCFLRGGASRILISAAADCFVKTHTLNMTRRHADRLCLSPTNWTVLCESAADVPLVLRITP